MKLTSLTGKTKEEADQLSLLSLCTPPHSHEIHAKLYSVLLLLVFSPLLMAESPRGADAVVEGQPIVRPTLPAETASSRIDGVTWTLLGAAGGARALDAYSTQRMLKNSCSSGQKRIGVSTCNYEHNLPAFIGNHASGIYAVDGAVWLSELAATRFLIRHNHPRLARLVPFIDFISTTSFAVNNLTLPIGEDGGVVQASSNSKIKFLW